MIEFLTDYRTQELIHRLAWFIVGCGVTVVFMRAFWWPRYAANLVEKWGGDEMAQYKKEISILKGEREKDAQLIEDFRVAHKTAIAALTEVRR